ncbi:hypothetical protein RF55_1024 [Lasius niger]|uniref:Uncharacterized protein n=1 Tax=Lasius niger TaxID=67767 RepID=A0A0J7L7Y3_LASNI|nr:hypothetical protein RF55_1024 [Lasius niger]
MIVSNIIAVTFLVIIGTTFGISATQLDKQGLELKPKVNVLLGAFSDFGVVRRSLSPVLIERYSINFAKDKRHVSKNNNKLKNVIEKLKASVTFRDNILYIFSYLLYGRKTGFTEEQYTSLQILYEFLKKKTVYMYNLLPILSRLSYMDKNQQTGIILLSLIKNLPPYLRCTARFLANEIEQERIDLNILLSQTTSETFNYLANINLNILRGKLKIVGEEMKGYDKYSNITQKALGPVFVTLLYNLHEHKLPLSQELFGLILINLPNPNDDPVLEENIRYLYDLTKNNVIDHRNWDLIGEDPVPISSDAYTLVFSVLSKILVSNVGMVVKNAAAYVYHHLRLVMTPTYDNPNMVYLHRLLKQNIDIGMLFSAIVPQEFGPDAIRLKDRLVTYFMHNYRNEDLNKILNGFNKFAYRDPLDLLVAFLTRLVNRIPSFPNANLQMIQQSATALLSTLIVKKSTRTFMPFVSPEIDVLILIESLKIPDIDPAFQSTIDSIKLELISQPHISVLVSTLLPTEKHNCLIPIQCLMSTFQNIQRLQNNLPMTLITNIQTIAYILKTRLTQLQNYFIPQFFVDTEIVYYNVSDYEIRHTKKTPKVPNSLNESLYGWNLNNYYNMTPVKQVGLLETTKRQTMEENKQTTKEMESSINTESTKTKVESSTITTNEAQVTEHVKSNIPSQENLSEQLLTSSLATTSTSYDSSEITNKPLQKQKKKQPLLWMSGIPTDIDEKTNVGFLNTKEGEISSQPNTSEESESQTYSLEETDKDITTKSTRLATIHKNRKRKNFTQKSSPQKTTNTEKLTTTTTVLPSSIEQIVTKKQESNLGFSHTKEEEISSQSNTSEEIESQTYSLEEVNKDVTTKQPTQSVKIIRKNKKEETSLPQKTTNASEKVTTIVLPPSIEPNEPLKIQLTDSGVPIITPDDHNKTVPGLVLPQIMELVKPANINDLFSNNNTPIVTQILQPLSGIFGKNYIKKILQDVNMNVYSTNIALLLAILKKATTYQQVTSNTNLINLIQKYITTIEYVSPTILLPIVVSSKKLVSEVVYSTFNPHDLTYGGISEKPPVEASPDTITIPLVNPKIWLQSINPSDPYADLLPTLEKESILAILIQPLKNILTSKKIVELLGPDFQPLVYPNKGALLITLLQKLRKVKTIQLDSDLKSLIDMYIYAIEIPSMNIQVSEDNFVKMMSETTGQWQPELTSLIVALPTVKNSAEAAMIRQIEHLLADPTLLEKLRITKPSSTMSRGELLHKIILSALSGKTHLKKQVLKAFRYYKDKVEFTDMGALPIMWIWIETYVVKAEVNLGSMIQQTVDFNQLAYKEKVAYNDLITYLAQNPNLLQDNENFEFQKYKTQGQFIKGLFKHLLTKPQINNKIKKNIQKLLSRVMLTGPGAIAIPSLSEF